MQYYLYHLFLTIKCENMSIEHGYSMGPLSEVQLFEQTAKLNEPSLG